MQNRPNQLEFICRAFWPKDPSRLISVVDKIIKDYNKIHPEAALETQEIKTFIQQGSWRELSALNLAELQILREFFFQLAEFPAEEGYSRTAEDLAEIANFVKLLDRIEEYKKSNRVGGRQAIKSFLEAYQHFNIEECCRLSSDMDDGTWEKCLKGVKSFHLKIDKFIEKHNRVFKKALETHQKKYSDAEKKIQDNPDFPTDFIKDVKFLETDTNKNLERIYNRFLNTNKRVSEMASLVNHPHKEFDKDLLGEFKQLKWNLENKPLYLIWLIDKLIADIQTRNPNSDKVNQLKGIKSKVQKNDGSFKSLLKEIESVCSKRQFFFDFREPKSFVLFESLEGKRIEAEIAILNEIHTFQQSDGGSSSRVSETVTKTLNRPKL